MNDHECVIGIINHSDYYELASVKRLREHIQEQIDFNESLDADPMLRNVKFLRAKCFTMKSYGDRRKSTDLSRFEYCPYCGKKIDWKVLKEGADHE